MVFCAVSNSLSLLLQHEADARHHIDGTLKHVPFADDVYHVFPEHAMELETDKATDMKSETEHVIQTSSCSDRSSAAMVETPDGNGATVKDAVQTARKSVNEVSPVQLELNEVAGTIGECLM